MSLSGWPTQESHLQSHNQFYSAIFGEEDEGLVDIGYHVVGQFTRLADNNRDITLEPAYTLYNNEFVIFVEMVEPGDISEADIQRAKKYNQIHMEAVEDYLKRVGLSLPRLEASNVENFDHFFVLTESQYDSHRRGTPDQQSKLDRLEREGCIVTINPGRNVKIRSDTIHGQEIETRLKEGIQIPEKVAKNIYLPKDIEKETLAVAICEHIVAGGNLAEDVLMYDLSEIRREFNRQISYDDLQTVFDYLRKVGACRKRKGEESYYFSKHRLDTILGIRNVLANRPFESVLGDEGSPDQSSLGEFD